MFSVRLFMKYVWYQMIIICMIQLQNSRGNGKKKKEQQIYGHDNIWHPWEALRRWDWAPTEKL